MSNRSRFLREALRCYEAKDGTGLHDLAVDLDEDRYSDEVEGFSEDDNLVLREMDQELSKEAGALRASERTRVGTTASLDYWAIIAKYLRRLSPTARNAMISAYEEVRKGALRENSDDRREVGGDVSEAGSLDCYYASEVLQKLETVVSRAVRLDRISVEALPNSEVQRYFQEAHDCHLYGFDIASTVLCRAILESSLEQLIPPQDRTGMSLVGAVDLALQRGYLTEERASWARQVATAGNRAIHDYQRFQRTYGKPDEVQGLLLKTRAVIADLYSKRT